MGTTRRHRRAIAVAFVLLAPLAVTIGVQAPAASAAPLALAVTRTADDHDAGSLRNAVDQANQGAGAPVTITLDPGEYVLDLCAPEEDANAAGDLDLTRGVAVTLQGSGPGATIRQTCVRERVLDARGTALLTLDNVTITGGNLHGAPGAGPSRGGALRAAGPVSLTRATFTGNVVEGSGAPDEDFSPGAASGGAVSAIGDVSVSDSTFTDNVARGGSAAGELVAVAGDGHGGAIETPAAVHLVRTTFTANHASGGTQPGSFGFYGAGGSAAGGAVAAGSLNGTDVTATDNHANGAAGGYFWACQFPFLCGTYTGYPGGTGSGGAFEVTSGAAAFHGLHADGNGAEPGWGYDDSGQPVPAYAAGGLLTDHGSVSMDHAVVTRNRSFDGGAISSGPFTARTSTFSGNVADHWGGALSSGAVALDGVTVADNRAASVGGDGGGVHAASVVARNSTFSGNTAMTGSTPLAGAAVAAPSVTLDAATAMANTGSSTIQASTLTVARSVLVQAAGGTSCGAAAVTSTGSNWSDDAGCLLTGPGDHTGTEDVLLGALQDNGGPTPTREPAAGSPLVDAAAGTGCPAVDQRGVPRPQGAACDIGAVERADGTFPASDLGVTVTGPAQADTDTVVDFEVVVSATGGTGFPTMTVDLPPAWDGPGAGAAPGYDAPAGAVCALADPTTLRCTWPAGLTADTSATTTVHARMPASVGTASLGASVFGPGPDAEPGNNWSSATTVVRVVADLAITGASMTSATEVGAGDPPTLGRSGTPQTVHVDVTNFGPAGVVGTDAHPVRLEIDGPAAVSVSTAGQSPWHCSQQATHTTCSFVGTFSTSSIDLNVAASLLTFLGPKTFTFTLGLDQLEDPHPESNAASLPFVVVPTANLSESVSVSTSEGVPVSTFVVANNGPDSATAVQVHALFPAGTSVPVPVAVGWQCSLSPPAPPPTTTDVLCTRSTALAAGTSATLSLGANLVSGATGALETWVTSAAESDAPPVHQFAGLAGPTGTYFHPVAPTRVLDSRGATGGWGGPLAANVPRTLAVAGGPAAIPAGARAVALNVTVTQPDANSFLTVYPAGGAVPTASNLNFARGQTTANAVTVAVGPADQIAFANAVGTTHVIVDVVGYYDDLPGVRFDAVAPTRLLDSRIGKGFAGKVTAGAPRTLQVTSAAGPVPRTATAVVINTTVTGGTANSFLTVTPDDGTAATTSNLNFAAGQTTANLVTVPLSAAGALRITNAAGAVHVVADVVGYFDPTKGGTFHAVAPTRLLDSRTATGGWGGMLAAAAPRVLTVASGARAAATAVVGNTTVTASTAPSYLTVQPAGAAATTTSNINFDAGQTIPNLVTAKVGTAGQLTFRTNAGATHVVFDLVGWYDFL